MGKIKSKKLEKVRIPTRRDWENNHIIIQEAYFKLLKKNERIPTVKQLMEVTGFSDGAIENHIKTINIDKIKNRLLPMIESVILKLGTNAAESGKAPEVKLFLQVIGDWRERNEVIHEFNAEEAKKAIQEIFVK